MQSNPCNIAKATPATMAGNITGNPAIATTNPATIDAVTLCEVINLTNAAPIPGESLPSFHPIRSPYYIIQRRSDPGNASLVSLTLNDGPCLYTTSDTAHGEVRNLFVGRSWTAVGGRGIQPRLQVKTISVALPTATQNLFWRLSRDPAFLPPNSDRNPISLVCLTA